MIKDIRAYIKSEIIKVDSELKESSSAFFDADLGETIIDQTYSIQINNIVSVARDNTHESSMDVVISIFGFGYRNEIERYDALLSKAVCIGDNLLSLQNFSGKATILDIAGYNIEASQMADNDNGFKIDINLTLKSAYTRE